MTVVQKRMKSKDYEEMPRHDAEFEMQLRDLLRANDPIMRTKSQRIAKTLDLQAGGHGTITDEKVRAAIRALIVHWHMPIRARREGGFEIIKNIEALQVEAAALRKRANAIIARAEHLEDLAKTFNEQLELGLEK